MGFWGKAIGIGFGFMLGGPLGAVFGGILGHMYDEEKDEKRAGIGLRCPHCGRHVQPLRDGHCPVCGSDMRKTTAGQPQSEMERQFLFYVTLTSLAAKMAKVDGVVSKEEIHVFDRFLKEDLKLTTEERKIVAQIFNNAKNSPDDPMAYARQFRQMIGHQPEIMQEMIHLLFRIAMADGRYLPAEENFIRQVAEIFGLSPIEFEQIRALFVKVNHQAYQVLGITPEASVDEIKSAYKKMVNQYHPDRLMSKGIPEDFIQLANEKMIEINSAYEQIRKERGF
ncbi:TerB family tellurite resistance protein [Caldithrix abyssi]